MMNHKNENMDEEKSFEVIQEGAPQQFDNAPHLVRRGLTEVSAMFDRTGKGYLDDTERALRRMDSQDKGYLGIDKVCVIFETLQVEQERSSQLLEALRVESKKSLNLKKGVIALSVFTILLALANVATSFAVTKLVKDTQVSHGDLMAKNTAIRVGTTSKLMIFDMESLDEGRRRRLQADAGLICETMAETVQEVGADGTPVTSTEKECSLQGLIMPAVAKDLHEQLNAVDKVLLTCNNKKSTIHGGEMLPAAMPAQKKLGEIEYMMYPSPLQSDTYNTTQMVRVPAQAADPVTGQGRSFARDCKAGYSLVIWCPVVAAGQPEEKCLVMSSYNPIDPTNGCGKTAPNPVICGPLPPPTPAPGTTIVV